MPGYVVRVVPWNKSRGHDKAGGGTFIALVAGQIG